MEHVYKNIAIIGAGAAGCLCAYFLLKKSQQYCNYANTSPHPDPHPINGGDISITLFDKGLPLRTLLPTGGGRCNLAHAEYDFRELAKNYPRGEKFLYSVFSCFATAETLEIFEELGIETYTQENGRIYPISNSAKDVREKILEKITKAHFVKEEVTGIEQVNGGFKVKTVKNPTPQSPPSRGGEVQQYFFTDVIIATGGHSGYKLLKDLDINIIEPHPSLVGLNTKEDFKELSGTVAKRVNCNGIVDDLLFTHFGVSGPLVYTISSIKAFDKFPYELRFDLCPELKDLQEDLNTNPHKEIKNIINKYMPQKIVNYILKGIDGTTKAHQINGKTRDLILDRIHNFSVSITGTNQGEETVTAGGVDLNEINPKTMGVKKVPNLYCIGEVLNIDGFCGGYNLQNAWSTAYVCAEGMKRLE